MRNKMVKGIFIARLNRFLAEVQIDSDLQLVHVPNTGRCKELLVSGSKVLLLESSNMNRKTRYTLHYIENDGFMVNIYSASANLSAYNSLVDGKIEELSNAEDLRREVPSFGSRIDLFCKCEGQETYVEVKGVTLIKDGYLQFPDAPTKRGTKHLEELIKLKKSGKRAVVLFVSQHPKGEVFKANKDNDPEFAKRLKDATEAGVELLVYRASSSPGEYFLDKKLPYIIE